jgi:molecular chaperone DnaK
VKKELVDKRNEAETAIFSAEKSLREYGDKVPAETKTAIEEKIKELKDVKDKDDAAAIDTATMNLSNELMKIYEVIQKAEQEKNTAGNATSESEPAAEEVKEEGTEENK